MFVESFIIYLAMGDCHIIIIFFASTHYTFFHLHSLSFKCFVIVVNHHVDGHIVNMVCILTLFVYFIIMCYRYETKNLLLLLLYNFYGAELFENYINILVLV